MLGENIKILRKEKGYSQETLAAQLHVVRQTVSKWEKGISVPDAQMLNQIAELLEVPVSTLLGDTVPSQNQSSQEDSRYAEIAKQLAVLNDQLAEQSSRKRRNFRRGGSYHSRCIIFILRCIPCHFYYLRHSEGHESGTFNNKLDLYFER